MLQNSTEVIYENRALSNINSGANMTHISLGNMCNYTLRSFSSAHGKKKVQKNWIIVTGHLIKFVLRANIVEFNTCNRSLAH